jgi:hypothetical protein
MIQIKEKKKKKKKNKKKKIKNTPVQIPQIKHNFL